MPSAFRDPKSLHEWIELDYYRRPRFLWRWRIWLTWMVLLVCALGVGLAWLIPGAARFSQAGPVSASHRMFNDDCARCHTGNLQTAQRFLPWNSNLRSVPDSACTQCHEGPPHNERQLQHANCASCHREHRGHDQLARVGDEHCTACHANIKANMHNPTQCKIDNVSRFAPGSHPEFALWRNGQPRDPSALRFNHKAHLKTEGIPGKGGSIEKLDCSSCHRSDAAGRYMEPINYDNHCGRCHPLAIQLAGNFQEDSLKEAAREFHARPLAHPRPGEKVEVVRALLRDRLIDFALKNPLLLGPEAERERIALKPPSRAAVTESEWNWVRAQQDQAEQRLFANIQLGQGERMLFSLSGGCNYCHLSKPRTGDLPRSPDDLPEFLAPNLPRRWYKDSYFNHQSHRMIACTECHAAPGSEQTADVLLPKMDACVRCHNPQTGTRSDCVECHTYHLRSVGGEKPKGFTISECLGK